MAQATAVKSYTLRDFSNPSGGGAALVELHTAGLVSQDPNGNPLQSERLQDLSVDQPFTLTVPPVASPAPAGTVSARIAFSTGRWPSNAPAVWLDELVINVL